MTDVKLKDFVRNALVDVAEAVSEANGLLKERGRGDAPFQIGRLSKSERHSVAFDVAVTVKDSQTDSAGFFVALVNLGGGASTKKEGGSEVASRIKFDVLVEEPVRRIIPPSD